jgi:hypothetical protein
MKSKINKKNRMEAIVICGSCKKEQKVHANQLTEPVDAYGDFIDIYFSGQEFERLTKRATKLKEKQQYSELASVYSYIADICLANAEEALKEGEKSKSEEDLKQAQLWQGQADSYRKESKELFSKLNIKELSDGLDENEVYENTDEQEFDMDGGDPKKPQSGKAKKGRTLDDILEDKGFLEF